MKRRHHTHTIVLPVPPGPEALSQAVHSGTLAFRAALAAECRVDPADLDDFRVEAIVTQQLPLRHPQTGQPLEMLTLVYVGSAAFSLASPAGGPLKIHPGA